MSVENLYLRHIQQLSIPERLELIRLLINSTLPIPSAKAVKKDKQEGLMKLAGAGKAFAMRQDAQSHVRQMRSEWD